MSGRRWIGLDRWEGLETPLCFEPLVCLFSFFYFTLQILNLATTNSYTARDNNKAATTTTTHPTTHNRLVGWEKLETHHATGVSSPRMLERQRGIGQAEEMGRGLRREISPAPGMCFCFVFGTTNINLLLFRSPRRVTPLTATRHVNDNNGWVENLSCFQESLGPRCFVLTVQCTI